MSDLRITAISIADTFGCKAANFCPGTVTRVSGANGEGKSSILRALLYVFSGGLDPAVIRKGAERSVISFELSNGVIVTKTTAQVKPRRGANPDDPIRYKADLEITNSDGTVINAPQSYVAELGEALAVDPSVLLKLDTSTAPGRAKLASELMRLVPITFEIEEVEKACGYRSSPKVGFNGRDASALAERPTAPLNLDGLKKVVTQITEQRRRVGATKDDTDGAVTRLQKSLPEDDGVDHTAKLHELESQQVQIQKALGERKLDVQAQASRAIADAQKDFTDSVSDADKEYAAAVAELEQKRSAAKSEAQGLLAERKERVHAVTSEEVAKIEAEFKPQVETVSEQLAITKERLANHHRAATLRQEIEIQLATCQAAAFKYEQLTGVLANLEALRLEKLNHLPVAGLVVEEGEAYLDGIPWDKVNLARRVEAVLQICTQRSGKLPLLIVDDAEHLDSQTRQFVEEGLAAAGFQLIEAVVTDRPLTIEIVNSPVAA